MELRGKTIERERVIAEEKINQVVDEKPIGKRQATQQEIKDASGDD
jgi:hypothetical protein